MSTPPELSIDAFPRFFQSLYGHKPFRWQTRLAEQACAGEWPRYIKLPTSSGKTSCIDIAVFALAYQAWRRHSSKRTVDVPRRIFFVVDRRIIVNEAYRRAANLKNCLGNALKQSGSAEYEVAWWLRDLAGNEHAPPLDCFELRGGIYRDDAWVRSLLQPTIITSTVDQVGSRILFRGYGVSDRNLPIHAALTGNDALILLDEAHCSNPFSQTMAGIARYRDAGLPHDFPARWSEQPLRTPFRFIEMTATPPAQVAESDVFRLEDADYQVNTSLNDRHGCAKPVRLVESNAKGAKQNQTLAKHLVEQAVRLAEGSDGHPGGLRIAIVVNRVACAREAYKLLRDKFPSRVDLMIGRMRPIDRDRLTTKLQARFQSGSREALTEPHFIVATQCLEVGADFDFDGLVTQCASLDALRQRFGRLNRLGKTAHSRGVIVMAEGDKAPRKPDPIYDGALPATWEWLSQNASEGTIDFGVRTLDAFVAESLKADPEGVNNLSVEAVNAPVLMPAHVDLLCQTGPRPALEPEISPFLHGPNRGVPEVRICWRADLPIRPSQRDDHADRAWREECQQTLAVCPPSSSECLNVPLPQFKAWLRGDDAQGEDSGDLLGEQVEADEDAETLREKRPQVPSHRNCVVWNGSGCRVASGHKDELNEVYPNSLVVLPATAGGWSWLGHIPDAPTEPPEPETITDEILRELARIDVASEGFKQSRDREILRVHPRLMTTSADKAALAGLWGYVDDQDTSWKHSTLALPEPDAAEVVISTHQENDSHESPDPGRAAALLATRASLAKQPARQSKMIRYPGGYVVIGPRLNSREELPRASFDDEFDEHNLDADERISLVDHLADVAAETEHLVRSIDMPASLGQALIAAAERHDLGKADLRFQALLLNSSVNLAAMQPKLWAKSAVGASVRAVSTISPQTQSSDRSPRGFRHEMLSFELAHQVDDDLDDESRDAMLHAIAAHHGHARPFAPVVIDDAPPDVNLRLTFPPSHERLQITLSGADRVQCPAHRLDSGISDRFWRLTRRYGWWGLAWLETTLRLADWVASAQPSNDITARVLKPVRQPPLGNSTPTYCLSCVGLNGANPLGFLAALGLFRTATLAFPDQSVRMQWTSNGQWHPVLVMVRDVSPSEFIERISQVLSGHQEDDHFNRLGDNINVPRDVFREALLHSLENASYHDRTTADFYTAFGTDGLVSLNDGQTIQDTALRTMAGAGHQHFLKTMRNVIEACRPNHLEKALFGRWRYDDPAQTLSLRFDPADDNRYALRWRDPSGDPARKSSGSMLGANRLAIEALPLLPTVPAVSQLLTTAFKGSRSHDTYFNWPIWESRLPLSVVQSILSSRGILSPADNAQLLMSQGVVAVFSSQRITVGKVRNFTAGQALFVARNLSVEIAQAHAE